MSATPPNQAEQPAEITHYLETTDHPDRCRYTLTRFYRHSEGTIRVRFHRAHDRNESQAAADLLTTRPAARAWLPIIDNPASNWHAKTFAWGITTNPSLKVADGLGVLRRLADELAADAALILDA
ncbi:hypothetical protein AB0A63_13830 [Lentzea sp. NPDC042327]|uniref:hypothetical protein n=1 Tax=Lentzea sp. NPDC042327 TaxID=3154801 RepID=UPI0033D59A5D